MSDVFIDECGDRIESVLLVADPNGGLTVNEGDPIDRDYDKVIDYLEKVKEEISALPTQTLIDIDWSGSVTHVSGAPYHAKSLKEPKPMLAELFRDNAIAVINQYIKKRKDEL